MIVKLIVLLVLVGGVWLWWRRRTVASHRMDAGEARALLGLGPAASAEEVREAHRRLIQRVHPDAGGSAELATRVNAARDALLNEIKRR